MVNEQSVFEVRLYSDKKKLDISLWMVFKKNPMKSWSGDVVKMACWNPFVERVVKTSMIFFADGGSIRSRDGKIVRVYLH